MSNRPFSNQWKAADAVSHDLMVLDTEKLLVQVSATDSWQRNKHLTLKLPLLRSRLSYLPPPPILSPCQRDHRMTTQCLIHKHHGLDVPRANQPMFLDWVEFHLQFLKENKMQYFKTFADLLSTQETRSEVFRSSASKWCGCLNPLCAHVEWNLCIVISYCTTYKNVFLLITATEVEL